MTCPNHKMVEIGKDARFIWKQCLTCGLKNLYDPIVDLPIWVVNDIIRELLRDVKLK